MDHPVITIPALAFSSRSILMSPPMYVHLLVSRERGGNEKGRTKINKKIIEI
jgi:hypothetical protein